MIQYKHFFSAERMNGQAAQTRQADTRARNERAKRPLPVKTKTTAVARLKQAKKGHPHTCVLEL